MGYNKSFYGNAMTSNNKIVGRVCKWTIYLPLSLCSWTDRPAMLYIMPCQENIIVNIHFYIIVSL